MNQGIAIIGAGLMGRWHARTAVRLGRPVVAVVDRDGTAASSLSSDVRGATPFTSLPEMLIECGPRVVHVCTPLSSHAETVRAAFEHGAHVICEKPMTGSMDEARELLEEGDSAGRLLCPVHQFPMQRGTQAARRLLDGLGKPEQATFLFCSAGADVLEGDARDTVVADILPHPFSVMKSLWPKESLGNLEWQILSPTAGEVSAQCLMGEMPMAVNVSLSARPTRCQLQIRGSQGSLHLDFFHGFCIRYPGRVSRFRKMVYPFSDAGRWVTAAGMNLAGRTLRRETAYPGLRQLLQEFYSAVDGQGESPISPDEVLAVAAGRDRFLGYLGEAAERDR